MAIDLVEVTTCVSCPKPSALAATNITNTSATLGWTENGAATAWEFEYGIAGFTLGTGTQYLQVLQIHSLCQVFQPTHLTIGM